MKGPRESDYRLRRKPQERDLRKLENSSSAEQGDAKFRGTQTFVAGLTWDAPFMEGWLLKAGSPAGAVTR
jgi:hypothetical protein